MSKQIAVLGFHKIGEPADGSYPTWNYVSVERFREYLRILASDGWTVLNAKEFVTALDQLELLPTKSALITFDDGYRSTLTAALPCLLEFQFPGVVFVPTGLIGRLNEFDRYVEPDESLCTWKELAQLSSGKVSVEGHSVDHPRLSQLNDGELVYQLRECKRALEDGLGLDVTLFAYPYGDDEHPSISDSLMSEVGYKAAFKYGGGPFRSNEINRFHIPRLAMGPDSDLLMMLQGVA